MIKVGQRIQIILKVPELFWNKDNPNNKPEQVIVYHNQWLYGMNFLKYQVRLIKALRFLIKQSTSSRYPTDYNDVVQKAINYANNSDLEYMTNGNPCFDDGKENNNKDLLETETVLEFLENFENNNGYMFIEIKEDGTFAIDILSGLEDAEETKSVTPKEYFNLFYSEEKIEKFDAEVKKSVEDTLNTLGTHKRTNTFDVLDALKKKLGDRNE